jgi:para-aminobenzoate synthetase
MDGRRPLRTLLVDNYDSYTFNLFQLLATVNGAGPVVVANDASWLADLDQEAFDSIVISPGPGRPDRAADFGYSASVVAAAGIPLLGVCLGHQGIAVAAGAAIGPAPRARHGHLTEVRHDGKDLFRGLPQGFTAVRYHSLCVARPLPAALAVTAWAEDGVIMGVRRRDRPQWGVQFHPESVLTSLGRDLLANFAALTREHHATRPRPAVTISTRRPAACQDHRPAVRPGRARPGEESGFGMAVRRLPAAVDAEAVFTRLFARSRRAFWLDSARAGPGLARFSYLGDGSGPHAEFVTYRVGGPVRVHARGTVREHPGSIFGYLRRELATRAAGGPVLPFGFAGGFVGYFGYELKADCGARRTHRAPTPDACWQFADRMVVIDHEQGHTYLLALHDRSPASQQAAAIWLDTVADTLLAMPSAPPGPPPQTVVTPTRQSVCERWLARGHSQYLADVEECRRQLLAGESYEICLTNSLRLPAAGDGLAFYRRLRRANPAPYAAYLRYGSLEIACSSPERFLRIGPDRIAEAKPIKGTAPRGHGTREDQRLAQQLAADPKNRAENLIVTDLLRNDLGRVCEPGSVHVPRLAAVESYATVHQLVSTIRGQLRPAADAVDCVRACFPGGSMTGAPKLRTTGILDTIEGQARGIYSGAIGYLACNGQADLNIVIRTAVLANGHCQIGAGGAIVLDSDPETEYTEMLLKAQAVLHAAMPAPAGLKSAPPSNC